MLVIYDLRARCCYRNKKAYFVQEQILAIEYTKKGLSKTLIVIKKTTYLDFMLKEYMYIVYACLETCKSEIFCKCQ